MRKLAWHLGLGDAIVFAGLAIKLANGDQLEVPCWKHNYESVKSFFVNHSNIHVSIVLDESKFSSYDIRLGHFSQTKSLVNENFIDWIYRQAEEDVNKRFDYCPLQEASKNVMQYKICTSEYAFVHDDESRGFKIDNSKRGNLIAVYPEKKESSILSYASILKEAKEIHCIDSSFLHLSETLETTGKLYYHKYARVGDMSNYTLTKNWEVLS